MMCVKIIALGYRMSGVRSDAKTNQKGQECENMVL